jgi:hypothetical protein
MGTPKARSRNVSDLHLRFFAVAGTAIGFHIRDDSRSLGAALIPRPCRDTRAGAYGPHGRQP